MPFSLKYDKNNIYINNKEPANLIIKVYTHIHTHTHNTLKFDDFSDSSCGRGSGSGFI